MRTGLGKLAALNLRNSPAFDVLDTTAEVWADAIWPSQVWSITSDDEERIAAAFRELVRVSEYFPGPKHFLAALKPRASVRHDGLTDESKRDIDWLLNEANRIRLEREAEALSHDNDQPAPATVDGQQADGDTPIAGEGG